MDNSRRLFLKSSLGLVAAVMAQSFPTQVLGSDFWSLPRYLWLYRKDTREQSRFCYFADGQLQWNGYAQACSLLRDVKANQEVQMNLVLLDILCGVQGWFRAYGVDKPLVINSGYRTKHTNDNTEGSAKNSMHLYGAAADIWMPGVPVDSIAKLGLYLKGGGVGFYPSRNFVHVDSGRLRTWRG